MYHNHISQTHTSTNELVSYHFFFESYHLSLKIIRIFPFAYQTNKTSKDNILDGFFP